MAQRVCGGSGGENKGSSDTGGAGVFGELDGKSKRSTGASLVQRCLSRQTAYIEFELG